MPGAAALAPSEVVAREEAEERAIPLSEAGTSIRNYVREALEARRPVGYDRKFLDHYCQLNRIVETQGVSTGKAWGW